MFFAILGSFTCFQPRNRFPPPNPPPMLVTQHPRRRVQSATACPLASPRPLIGLGPSGAIRYSSRRMAGFKTHITTSSILGVGYGATAFAAYHVPLPTCLLAAGLCGVSGMLPDLDSGPGRPLRESTAFAAAVVPMMMIDRFKHLGMAPESIVLAGAAIYLAIRFGVGWLLRHVTVHRGMFHSLPACAIAFELTFLLCAHEQEGLALRYFNGAAVVLGFMSHLILDEIWSIDFSRGIPHLKKSFGTAIKFWSESKGSTALTYGIAALLAYVMIQDPTWMGQFNSPSSDSHQMAKQPAVTTVRR